MSLFIENIIRELENELHLLIQYGSTINMNNNANDIDIFGVVDSYSNSQSFQLGRFDIILLNMKDFHYYCSLFDPPYCTEPLLNGKILFENNEIYNKTITQLNQNIQKAINIDYFIKRSNYEYIKIYNFLNDNEYLNALYSLTYSLSYRLFANWYSSKKELVSLNELIKSSCNRKAIEEIFSILKDNKKQGANINDAIVNEQIKTLNQIILS